MSTITDEALAALEALAEKATPGPWRDMEDKELAPYNADRWKADAAFIAAVRNTLPSFISRLRAAEKNRDEACGRMCVNCGRVFPASFDRRTTPADCPAQDENYAACTIDMTLQEAFEHWRRVAHEHAAELSRVKAERDEAKLLISGLVVTTGGMGLDLLCRADARAFLARMEAGR